MPELSEVAHMANFITKMCKNVVYEKLEKSPETKVDTDLKLMFDGAFSMFATSRGKELLVTFQSLEVPEKKMSLLMSMGMSGNWKMTKKIGEILQIPKHSHLRVYGKHAAVGEVVMCMVDTRRFAKWKWKENFSTNRGPCPVREHEAFKKNVKEKMKDKLGKIPMLDVIMNQSVFNGIGNYLRAEIFHRGHLNPFKTFEDYSENEQDILLYLCKNIPEQAFEIGGGAIKDWSGEDSDKNRFLNWLECYLKKDSMFDQGKRKFWFDSKWKNTEAYKKYIKCAQKL